MNILQRLLPKAKPVEDQKPNPPVPIDHLTEDQIKGFQAVGVLPANDIVPRKDAAKVR